MTEIVITHDGKIYTKDFQEPLHRSLGEAVGGSIEFVRTRRLGRPYCMIVNEIFIYLDLPINPVGCYYYATERHGHPICGDIVIMKEQEDELVDLDPDEAESVRSIMEFTYKALTRKV